jgi:hypothetical protein
MEELDNDPMFSRHKTIPLYPLTVTALSLFTLIHEAVNRY